MTLIVTAHAGKCKQYTALLSELVKCSHFPDENTEVRTRKGKRLVKGHAASWCPSLVSYPNLSKTLKMI